MRGRSARPRPRTGELKRRTVGGQRAQGCQTWVSAKPVFRGGVPPGLCAAQGEDVDAGGASKVRCGPATMLQPRLPSHGLHCDSVPRVIGRCPFWHCSPHGSPAAFSRARATPPARPEPRPAQGPSGAGWAAGGRRSRSVGATVLSGITVPLPAPAASFLRPLGPACGPGPKAFPTDGPAHSLSGQAALALGHRLSADPGLLALGRAVLRTLSGSARDTGPARVRRLSAGQRGWECRWQGGGVAYLEGLSLPRATFWANSKACRSGPLPGAGEGGGVDVRCGGHRSGRRGRAGCDRARRTSQRERCRNAKIEGVVAPRAHRVRTAATIRGQTPVHHPKMHPPKQPIKP